MRSPGDPRGRAGNRDGVPYRIALARHRRVRTAFASCDQRPKPKDPKTGGPEEQLRKSLIKVAYQIFRVLQPQRNPK